MTTVIQKIRLCLGGMFLLMGIILPVSCERGLLEPEGEWVAVQFSSHMTGEATLQSTSQNTPAVRSEGATYSGVTSSGITYRDYVSADGFETRAFYTPVTGIQTRTTSDGAGWNTNDSIGVFMLKSGGAFTTSTDILANNIQYKATPGSSASQAAFSVAKASEVIYYPQSSNVDFIAYYPYRAAPASDPYTYSVSVADQSTPAKIDVLYAKSNNIAKSKTAINLTFSHRLSKIRLNVKAGDGFVPANISGLTASNVKIGGMPVTAKLNLQDSTLSAGTDLTQIFNPLKITPATTNFDATFDAILIPQMGGTNRTVVFTVGGQDYTWTIADGVAFSAGSLHTYEITVKKTGVAVSGGTITDWTGTGGTPTLGTAEVLSVETVKIKAGTFLMGSSDGSNIGDIAGTGLNTTPAEPNRNTDETQHKVTLTKDFYMSKYQITNAQYAVFLNANGIGSDGKWASGQYPTERLISASSGSYDWGLHWNITDTKWDPSDANSIDYSDYPVTNVTWYGAVEYARWVGGSLPTEAQWEYACRGGMDNLPFGIGDGTTLTGDMANFNGRYIYELPNGQMDLGNGNGTYLVKTTSVGFYSGYANNYGLYDMHGNVHDWCSDWYGQYYGAANADGLEGTTIDPTGANSGNVRMLRGGNWGSYAWDCRSAYRYNNGNPNISRNSIGFRVVFLL